MGMRVVSGSLLLILSAACGGHIDPTTGNSDSVQLPPRPSDQGIYIAPKADGPEHVADNLGTPTAIAMTDERVVFTTRSATIGDQPVAAGGIWVADKVTGPALLLDVDHRGASFDALTTDGTTAFIATSDGRVLSIPVAGGATKTIATLDTAAAALTVSDNYVYVATSTGAVARMIKTGGELEPLATITGAIRGLSADDAAVYVATGAAEETPAGIVRVPLDGSAVTVLTSGGEPCAMIRDARRLFWTTLPASTATAGTTTTTTSTKGAVLRLSLDGGEVATVASGSFAACAIASDQDSLYFATTLPNALPVKAGGIGSMGLGLMRAPIAGGEPVAIAQASRALAQPGAVAVDATHIYWLTETAVLRLHK
jgi:hypothetical protein